MLVEASEKIETVSFFVIFSNFHQIFMDFNQISSSISPSTASNHNFSTMPTATRSRRLAGPPALSPAQPAKPPKCLPSSPPSPPLTPPTTTTTAAHTRPLTRMTGLPRARAAAPTTRSHDVVGALLRLAASQTQRRGESSFVRGGLKNCRRRALTLFSLFRCSDDDAVAIAGAGAGAAQRHGAGAVPSLP